MKKLITILLMLSMFLTYAQDYNKWSIEPEFGVTKVRDLTSVEPFNTDLGIRYMANTLFGVKLNVNYTDIDNLHFNNNSSISYYSAGLHGVVNIGRLLKFESFSNRYTILGGIGGTYTDSGKATNDVILHRISNFHLSAFVDNEFKLSKSVFLRVGLDVLTGVNSRPFTTNISTETTTILNFNMGLTIALSKGNIEHADWYIEEPGVEKVYLKPLVIDKTITNNITSTECSCKYEEYVFFKHDSYEVDKDGLNSIVKMTEILKEGENIYLIGYASPPASEEYNVILANKRAEAVKAKAISLGISEDRIIIEAVGEVDTKDSYNVDLSRRVKITIK